MSDDATPIDDLTSRVRDLLAATAVDDLVAMGHREALGALHRLLDAAHALHVLVVSRVAATGAFRADGATDTAAWLRTIGGRSGHAARLTADAARATPLDARVRAALETGALTIEAAAALADLVTAIAAGKFDSAELDALLDAARTDAPDAFRRRVRRREAELDHPDDRAARQRRNSALRTYDAADGMRGLHLVLDPERHTVVLAGIDAIVDEHWRRGHRDGTRPATHELPRLRADAMVELVRRSMDGERGGTAARRVPEVIVHIDLETLKSGVLAAGGCCELDDGTPLPVESIRRLACEADIIPLVLGGESAPLDVGRARRLATHAQRLALRRRSPTCEWACCDVSTEWCVPHHVDRWTDGGATDLGRLVWTCHGHHDLIHHHGWRLEVVGGEVHTYRPDGTRHLPEPLAAVRERRAA